MQTSDEPIRHCTRTTYLCTVVAFIHPADVIVSINGAQLGEEHDTGKDC